MPRGGVRPGQGRPKKIDELKIVNTATNAIISRYGSLEAGFEWLLKSQEPALIKFVFEHAAGKPKDNINLEVSEPIKELILELASNKDK